MGERDWHYCRPSGPGDVPTSHLMLCGPPAALESFDAALRRAGAICISRSAGHSHCFASFDSPASATAASQAVFATATSRDKILLRYVDARPSENKQRINLDVPVPAERTAESCGIPGLMLLLDFITSEEEAALLCCIDQQPWECLSRRRVQHYGKTFCYIVSQKIFRGCKERRKARPHMAYKDLPLGWSFCLRGCFQHLSVHPYEINFLVLLLLYIISLRQLYRPARSIQKRRPPHSRLC
jgi:hypothetical protein